MPETQAHAEHSKHDESYKLLFSAKRAVADLLRGFAGDCARDLDNGDQRWTAATDTADLFAPPGEALLGYLPRHRYLLLDQGAQEPVAKPRVSTESDAEARSARRPAGMHRRSNAAGISATGS